VVLDAGGTALNLVRLQRGPLVAAGVVIAFAGALLLYQRTQFVTQSIATDGTVTHTTRSTVGVDLAGGPQLPVKKPWLHLYRAGQRVRVRWQPDRTYPGQLTTTARIDSFSGLWLGPAVVMGVGAFFIIGGIVRSVTFSVSGERH
jgi:hypothetical protein